ncbi:cupin domain-containing protein [Pontibacter sp. JH31]|uniref:Cupin domain-containing protein n=1 Tax=Pontibacter aquaedesilientis TaxID=2766980 RepID=A0ABR7XEF3_9BACT|nr:cupin domain-containing protein [Pontibacter aquaedesilientis]MBD1395756.1 cupin domain-containing protein [Pontibacter aquaedesilientis]
MNTVAEFIESGILELYVLGAASEADVLAVEKMAATHPEVKEEISEISRAMEHYAQSRAVKPRATVKTLLMATIDYLERMKKGELPESPPVLTPHSRRSDFDKWLLHQDAVHPADAEQIHARIIGYTPTATTAIVWVREQTEEEIHHDEHERFLIVEGTCLMRAGEKNYNLAAGDFFEVPLHAPHQLTVTSAIPCKAILQRLSVV